MSTTGPTEARPGLLLRVLRFPVTRLVLALAFIAVAGIVGPIVRNAIAAGLSLEQDGAGRSVLSMLVLVPVICLAYWAYVRLIERRPVSEFSRRGAFRELGIGVSVGAGLFSSVIAAIAVFGGYHVLGVNPLMAMLPIFTVSVIAGTAEEIVARGIIFRILEEGLGTWAALVISAALFGGLHHFNPGATWISSVSIALTAGLLLGGAFVLTRRLWLVIGIHFAWNFTQGGIFGVAVSGHEASGLLRSELSGPELIAGGAFGPEASIFAVLFCLPVAVGLVVLGHRRGQFARPMWRRQPG